MIIGRKKVYAGALDILEGKAGKVRVKHIYKVSGTKLMTVNVCTTFLGGQASEVLEWPVPTK